MTGIAPPDIKDLVYVDDVPRRPNPFGESKWIPVLQEIRRRGGEVAKLSCSSSKEATSTAAHLRGVSKRNGQFAVVTRGLDVYVTYIGG